MPDGPDRTVAAQQASNLRAPVAASIRAALREGPPGPLPVALAAAYDAVEDTAVRRQALTHAHLPSRVLWLLASYAVISAAMLGYALAGSRARHRVASITLYLLVSLAFGTILDLDRPRAGAIMVDQAPFGETVKALASPPLQRTAQPDPATQRPVSRQ